ncbi:SabA family sialic acid-binding adhesin, partial [Helicobacter pylori]|uniref:SabA family sialic acid-binding adhesin n=1 Tax=Helicobacter pylori TaxID=210 RepID=UPI000EADB900
MKKHILSLTLGSLLVSALSAEDDGFYMSAGYQIGEAAQVVTNTKGIQQLSDNYEKLNNLLNNYSTLNTLIKLSSDPSAVTGAINNLNAGANSLLKEKTNSPAYQAVSLALNAAVGLWNTIGYAVMCGNGDGTGSGPGSVVFNNQPGQSSTQITCNRYEAIGVGRSMSIEQFKKLNEAYQIIQQALKEKKGFPELGGNASNVNVRYKYECKQNGNVINGGVDQFCQAKNGSSSSSDSNSSSTQMTTQDGVTITTTYNNNEATVSFSTKNSAQELLNQAANIMQVLNTQCPLVRSTHDENAPGDGSPWGLSTSGNACQIFQQEFSQVTSMIKNAQEIVAQSAIANSNQQAEIAKPSNFNPFTDAGFAQSMLKNARAQAEMFNLAEQVKQDLQVMANNNNVNENLGRFGEGMTNFVSAFLASCRDGGGTLPDAGVTSNTWGAGCAYVGETISALDKSIAHFGTQAEQIEQAVNIADTLVNFKSRYNELGNTYNSITTVLSSVPNAQSLQNVVSKKNNPYSPQGIETNYYLNQNSYNQV